MFVQDCQLTRWDNEVFEVLLIMYCFRAQHEIDELENSVYSHY